MRDLVLVPVCDGTSCRGCLASSVIIAINLSASARARLEDARNSANLRRVRRVVPGKNRLLDTDRPLSPFSLGGGGGLCQYPCILSKLRNILSRPPPPSASVMVDRAIKLRSPSFLR